MHHIAKWTALALLGTGLLGVEVAGVRHAVLGASEWVASGGAGEFMHASRVAAATAGRVIVREARATALAAAVGALEGVGTVYSATQGPQPHCLRCVRTRVIEMRPCTETPAEPEPAATTNRS